MRDAARQALLVPGGAVVVEFEGRRKNGETFPVEASFSGWQGTDGFQYGAILRDISVRKREVERVRYLAEHDALTGLANRNMPQNAPQSLSDEDVYAVSAYVLNLNGLVGADATLDAKSLAAVKMPNRDRFVGDARPDVKK